MYVYIYIYGVNFGCSVFNCLSHLYIYNIYSSSKAFRVPIFLHKAFFSHVFVRLEGGLVARVVRNKKLSRALNRVFTHVGAFY